MSAPFRSLIFALLFFLAAGLVVWVLFALAKEPPPSRQTEPIFSVYTVTATVRAHSPRLALIGETEARDYAVLTSPIDTEILAAPHREGDAVKKGESLARLDVRELEITRRRQQAAANRAAAAVDDIQSQLDGLVLDLASDSDSLSEMSMLLDLADGNLKRDESLLEKGVIAQSRLEQSEEVFRQRRLDYLSQKKRVDDYAIQKRRLKAQLAQAETEIVAAEADIASTDLALERAQASSPFAGRIARVHISIGSRVGRGDPLVEVFNPNSLRLRAAVPTRYVPQLLSGESSRALIQLGGGQSAEVTLRRVSPLTDPGKGSVEAYFDLPSGDWTLGATREFSLVLAPVENAVAVPFDALYADSRVYRVDDENRARGASCSRIGTTEESGELRVILQCPAVRDGERIITTRLANIVEGVRLSVAE